MPRSNLRTFLPWSPLLMAALIASATSDASASAISYEFSGVITSADASTGMAPGTPFSGTFTDDPKDLSESLGFEGYRSYLFGNDQNIPHPGLPHDSGMTLSIGGQPMGALQGGLGVSIYESQMAFPYASPLTIQNETFLTIGTGDSNSNPMRVALSLTNDKQTVYSSLDLPSTINLANFPSATISVYASGSATPLYSGTIDTLEALPTPEPSTAWILGVGLAAWLARSKLRRG